MSSNVNNDSQDSIQLPVAKPNKIYVAGVKIRQMLYRNKTSYPYLSSDAFVDLCEVSYPYHEEELTAEFVSKLINAKKVFCPSHLSSKMLENYGHLMNAELLIFSNSDHEFHDQLKNLPTNVKLILLENSYISDDKLIFTLPIGIENLRVGMNGMKGLFKTNRASQKLRQLLVGPFSPTHPIRRGVVLNFLSITGPWAVINHRMNPKRYAAVAKRYGAIACVRGNSVESHRLWETLYRGSIPLVLRDKWAESLKTLNLPLQLVESWDPSHIREILDQMKFERFNPESVASLWMPYWENFIDEKLHP